MISGRVRTCIFAIARPRLPRFGLEVITATESIRCPESGPRVTSDLDAEHSRGSCAFARAAEQRTRRPGVKRIRTIIGALTVLDMTLTPAVPTRA